MAIGYTSTSANARTSFSSLMKHKGEVRKVFYRELAELPDIYTNFCAVASSNAQYELENAVGGRPKWSVTSSEGEEFTYGDFAQGTEITYTNLEYKDAFDVTLQMAEDNQVKGIMSSTREMAKGGKSIVEEIATDILDNAFTSGTGADGGYLCVSDHNLINSGSTGDNAMTNQLNAAGLKAAVILARTVRDESYQFSLVKYDTLVVPPALEEAAIQLVKSGQTPEDGNNSVNPYSGRYRVVVNPYLASATAWYLAASGNSAEAKPRFYWRVKPQFFTDKDIYSRNLLFAARERFIAGFTSWQHIIGSTGAGS